MALPHTRRCRASSSPATCSKIRRATHTTPATTAASRKPRKNAGLVERIERRRTTDSHWGRWCVQVRTVTFVIYRYRLSSCMEATHTKGRTWPMFFFLQQDRHVISLASICFHGQMKSLYFKGPTSVTKNAAKGKMICQQV